MSSPQHTPLMSEKKTALLGGLLVAIGPVSMALFTPAMPTLAAVFSTTPAAVKLTLTSYFAGFALTQLICGPLSDAYGRRPVAAGFLFVYLIASIATLFAPNIHWLIAARGVQGIGAAVGVAVARAIVRDQYVGQTSARIMNLMAMVLVLGPALAPTIGGIALELAGWKAAFILMAILGLMLIALVHYLLPETNRHPDLAAIRPDRLLRNYGTLLCDPRFMRPALAMGFAISLFYTMATIMPFVLIGTIGLSPSQFGYAMLLQSLGFGGGVALTSVLLRRFDASRLISFGFSCMALAAVALVALPFLVSANIAAVMGPVMLLAFGIALMMPAMSTEAIAHYPRTAGAASALMGFLQMGGGFIGSLFAAALGDPLLALAIVVPISAIAGPIFYIALTGSARRRTDNPPDLSASG